MSAILSYFGSLGVAIFLTLLLYFSFVKIKLI